MAGPSAINRFDLILLEYPYGVVPTSSEVFTRLADEFLGPASQVRPLAFVRADWFIAAVTRPPLFEDLRGARIDPNDRATKPAPGVPARCELVDQLAREYRDQPVTAAIAAAELGVDRPELLQPVWSNARSVQVGLAPLANSGSIRRDTWEAAFPVAVHLLGAGLPVVPLEGVSRPVAWSVDRHLTLELTSNKPDNIFRPGDDMIIRVKNTSPSDLTVELIATGVSGGVVVLTKVPVLIPPGKDFQFPAQGEPPIRVMDMTGKERITAFAGVGSFAAGNILRGRNTSDRFLHDPWRDGLRGLKIMDAFGLLKTSIELETRSKAP